MSRRTKLTFFLSLATIFNLFGYLFISGSWKIFFRSPVPREFSDRNVPSFEKEMAALLHKATDVHHLSAKNMTRLINKVMKDEFNVESILPEQSAPKEGNKEDTKKSEKLNKKDDKLDAQQDPVLIPEKSGNAEQVEKLLVEENKQKDPSPQDEKEDKQIIAKEEKKSVVTKKETTDVAKEQPKKGGILSAVGAFMKGKVERPVNPHDFNYLINEPSKCKNEDGSDKDVFLLVLICSVHKNFENRNAIRQSWGSPTEINGHKVITMFLLAKKSDDKLQELVLEENEQYHDIIMEDFVDTYKNLTLKTIMGMKWMSTFCPHAKFMMKTDDDMYVSYANIIKYIDQSPKTNFVTGMVINGGPIRDPKSKWYMPKTTYPGSKYPPFCSGTGYILSGDVPPKVYSTSLSTPYLYLEDVYVAVCLDKLHIIPKNHKEFHNWRTTYTLCHFRRILTAHMVTPTEMIRYWNDQTTNKHKC